MKWIVSGCSLVVILGTATAQGTDVSEQYLMSHVRFLASGLLEGRGTGQTGDLVAEAYIQAIFEQAGLEPLPALNDFGQDFFVLESELDREKTTLGVVGGGKMDYFHVDREVFLLLRGHSDRTIEAPVVFAGFGITAPEYDYDDYAGIDVKGKVVLVLNNEPGGQSNGDRFRGRAPTRYSFPKAKEEIARRNGAVGIIIVSDAAYGGPDIDVTMVKRYSRDLELPHIGLEDEQEQIPLFFAAKPVAGAIVEGTDIDLVERQERIDGKMKPASADIPGKQVSMNIRLSSVVEKRVRNVIGYLEGGDPSLKHEFVLVSAHHDHLGMDKDGTIYYGADDNASGVAGLLETARILADGIDRLGRSLLFVSFCGEERGLLGSKYLIHHLPIPFENLRVMVNLDMIGRNNMDKAENDNMFIVFTSAQTPSLERTVRSEAKMLDLDVRVAPYVRFRGASDHTVFHDRGIPVVFYFTGFHSDYDRPTDTADKIISSKLVKVVSHLSRLVVALSTDSNINLEFDRAITVEPKKDFFENPYTARAGHKKETRSQTGGD